MLKQHKTIISEVFEKIAGMGKAKWYDADTFPEAQSCPLDEKIRFPRGPGDRCYDGGVTAFRITGEDPVYGEEDAKDVPQPVIDAFRKAFMDGLRIAFPDDALKDYMTASLLMPAFAHLYNNPAQYYEDIIERQFPRILTQSPQPEERILHLSLEHDIDRGLDADYDDMLSAPRTDRHHLTNTDLLRTYRTLAAHPEIAVGLAFWQHSMEQYARELCIKLEVDFAKAAINKADGHKHGHSILNHNPIYNTVFFVKNNIEVATIPLFFITAAVAESQKANTNTNPDRLPTIDDFRNGMSKALRKGIFLRRFDSEFGERQTVCPFGPFGVRWLHMEMGNGKSVLENCIRKIETERGLNPKVDVMCEAASHAFSELIKRSDQQEIERLDKTYARRPRKEKSVCPFRHTIDAKPL